MRTRRKVESPRARVSGPVYRAGDRQREDGGDGRGEHAGARRRGRHQLQQGLRGEQLRGHHV